MKKLFGILFLVLVSFSSSAFVKNLGQLEDGTQRTYLAKYVIVLVIDGPRWSETYGDTSHQYIPRQYNDLLPQATFVNNFRNEGPTYTNPGHAAICTGVYQNISNDGKSLPKHPSMFQYFMKEKRQHRTSSWVISPKGKLNILANCRNKKWRDLYMPYVSCGKKATGYGYARDSETWPDIVRILNTFHPRLALINLLEADVQGHAKNWEGYLDGIRNTDEYAFKLWEIIQNDEIYKDKTALIITNDHGRHIDGVKDGFISHGDGCEGCRKISFMCLGPDFEEGKKIDTPFEQIDIAPTVAEILGFSMPTADGEVMWDIFK